MPLSLPQEIYFSEHDMLRPFPVEQKGRYSLAHIRRVVQALGDVDLAIVVQNVVELLSTCEPGQ